MTAETEQTKYGHCARCGNEKHLIQSRLRCKAWVCAPCFGKLAVQKDEEPLRVCEPNFQERFIDPVARFVGGLVLFLLTCWVLSWFIG